MAVCEDSHLFYFTPSESIQKFPQAGIAAGLRGEIRSQTNYNMQKGKKSKIIIYE